MTSFYLQRDDQLCDVFTSCIIKKVFNGWLWLDSFYGRIHFRSSSYLYRGPDFNPKNVLDLIFTSQTGARIISQLFHNSPILQVTCSTFDRCAHLSHLGRVEQRDVMTILHDDVTIAVIDGFTLFQTLRACRSHHILGAPQNPSTFFAPFLTYLPMQRAEWRKNLPHFLVVNGNWTIKRKWRH